MEREEKKKEAVRWVAAEPIVPLYEEADVNSPREDELLCGMRAEILREKAGWQYIDAEYGFKGWVEKGKLVPWEGEREDAEIWQIKGQFADVLQGVGVKCPLLESLPMGARVRKAAGEEDGWTKIRLPDGRGGYMQSSKMEPLPEPGRWSQEELRKRLVARALTYRGASYRWGGKTPLGIDCSGLTFMSYWLEGIVIYRNAKLLEGFPIKPISFSKAGPGDLLYFPGHVAMLLNKTDYLHSTGRAGSDGVVINSLDPKSPRFRRDLWEKLLAVGSIFG